MLKRIIEAFLLNDMKSFSAASKATRKDGSPLGRSEAARLWQAVRKVMHIRHAYFNRKKPTRVRVKSRRKIAI